MNKLLLLLVAVLSGLAGCSSLILGSNEPNIRQGASSSLVDYLYPDGQTPPEPDAALPQLELPLNVGLAFVPAADYRQPLSAVERDALLEQVAAAFRDRPYVASIQVIPATYLAGSRGHQGMRQVASVFGVDAMALVSYDQLTLSSERDSALLYWTVVGALVVKGNRNEVQTLVDTAVFDVASGELLFRAPGAAKNGGNATLMDEAVQRRELAVAGFEKATDDMIVNLDTELEALKEAVKNGERIDVAWREGAGGGSAGLLLLGALAGTLAARRARRCRRHYCAPASHSFGTLQNHSRAETLRQ